MKTKFFTLFLALMACVNAVFAVEYGILVNGKMYFAATYEGSDPYGQGFEQYLSHVQLNAGDYCQLYDAESEAAWAVDLDASSDKGFTRNGDRYNVSVTGCYDFYIKLKYQSDQLYIGPGSDCSAGVDITEEEPVYASAVPEQCADVMLQAFYWDSYQDKGYGRTKWIDYLNANNGTSAEEIGKWFDLVWLPPMSKSTGGTGYMPLNYSDLDSDWGTTAKLKQLIGVLHENGAKVVADIVINHAGNRSSWCDFNSYNFGKYGTFYPDASYICKTDEVNTTSSAGSCQGKATGAKDDGYGSDANFDGGRDWDHTNPEVQAMFNAYLKWLRNTIKIDGFRYDYCKGYHNSHINDYNKEANAYFSVMEYWDGNPDVLVSRLNDAEWNTTAFDFNMKYDAFNNGIAQDNYCALKGVGLQGKGKSRYAVTFLDNHDTFQRDNSEFCGLGNSMNNPGKVLQCYAYLLSMPGIPCVFFPHWVSFKDEIKAMINARYKTKVHSESAVSDECGNGYYKATVTGKNGEIRVLIGPKSGYDNTPAGYRLAVKGDNFGVYYKLIEERNDKDQPDIKLYTVSFMDWDNQLIAQQVVEEGQAALAPENPTRRGYTFVGWDKDFSNVTEDLVVTALYEKIPLKDYTLLFTSGADDSEIDAYSVQFYLPEPPVIPGFVFLKWIVVGGDFDDKVVFQAVYHANEPSSAPEVYTNPANPAQKLIRNGNVYILRDDKVFTVTGQKVR